MSLDIKIPKNDKEDKKVFEERLKDIKKKNLDKMRLILETSADYQEEYENRKNQPKVEYNTSNYEDMIEIYNI